MKKEEVCKEKKEKGNAFFRNKEYFSAVESYTEALTSWKANDEKYLLYGNRSLCFFFLGEFEKALEDSLVCIGLNPDYQKGYHRKVQALKRLGLFFRSKIGFEYIRYLNPKYFQSHLVEEYISTVKSHINQYYVSSNAYDLSPSPFVMKWIGMNKGKGLFSTRSITSGEIIFEEKPIISSHINSKSNNFEAVCSYCMKTKLSKNQLKSIEMKPIYSILYNNNNIFLECDYCNDEVFCSLSCKKKCWNEYHNLLCKRNKNSDNSDNSEDTEDTEDNSDTEDIIKKIFAKILSKMNSSCNSNSNSNSNCNYDWESYFEPYFSFYYDVNSNFDWDVECRTHATELIREFDNSNLSESVRKLLGQIITSENYRFLHSVIQLNASSILGVSGFHLFLERKTLSTPKKETFLHLPEECNPNKFSFPELGKFVESEKLRLLCLKGTGLFKFCNSLNHDCNPNVVLINSQNSSVTSLMAFKPISQGQELCISYIDENLPFLERKELLKQHYNFSCQCGKCTQQA